MNDPVVHWLTQGGGLPTAKDYLEANWGAGLKEPPEEAHPDEVEVWEALRANDGDTDLMRALDREDEERTPMILRGQ